MARKNFILMFGIVSLSIVAFALLVHSLNTQAIGEERENIQGTPFIEGQMVGQDPVFNNIPPENQPPEDRWIPLASDPRDLNPPSCDIKTVYYQVYSGILYFKVEHYANWENQWAFDVIYLDVDRNASTGRAKRGIGWDVKLIIKNPSGWLKACYPAYESGAICPKQFDYLDLPYVGNTYVVGLYLCFCWQDSVEQDGTFDFIIQNDEYPYDYVPDTGHLTMDLCFCADPNADGKADVVDVVYLINYVFKSGPAPQCR